METYLFKRDNWLWFGLGDLSVSKRAGFLSFGKWTFRWGKAGSIAARKAYTVFSFRALGRELAFKLIPAHALSVAFGWGYGHAVVVGPLAFGVYP